MPSHYNKNKHSFRGFIDASGAMLILYQKRDDPKVANHENLQGWLIITLRNKIASEMQRRWRHMEQPLEELSAVSEAGYEPAFRDSLPRQLTEDEKDLLCMFYEMQLSHREIGQILGIPEAASRMRLIRARNSYEKWKKLEEKTEKMLLHSAALDKYKSEEVLRCPKQKECLETAGRAL